jgi:hypothetical protein
MMGEPQLLGWYNQSAMVQSVTNAMASIEAEYSRPSITFRPKLSRDGNRWCALYGENLIEGIAGFGDTADLAMRDFDKRWYTEKLGP